MKLKAKLPGSDANGLVVAGPAMLRDPKKLHVVIGLVDCSSVETDTDTGVRTPTARLRRVEVLLPDDKSAAEQLLRRALDSRLGATVLPLELEDEINLLFGEVDVIAEEERLAAAEAAEANAAKPDEPEPDSPTEDEPTDPDADATPAPQEPTDDDNADPDADA